MKIYAIKPLKIFINMLIGIFIAVIVFLIVHIWANLSYSIALALLVFIAYIWKIMISNFVTIIINGDEMKIKDKRGTNIFSLKEHQINAQLDKNSRSFTLENKSGEIFQVSCELLETETFYQLLSDIGIPVPR